jgi:HPt (histidine-containing phosphotransfer) domain-containing protein
VTIPDDPFIIELLPEFIDSWIEDIKAQMDPLIEKKDPDELYRFGHTLKGSCFQFGLDEVAQMGIELMGYAKESNWDKAADMGPKLEKAFQDVKVFVDQNLKK